jgi:hypothetical protein
MPSALPDITVTDGREERSAIEREARLDSPTRYRRIPELPQSPVPQLLQEGFRTSWLMCSGDEYGTS